MKYIYDFAYIPATNDLLQKINAAADRLGKKIRGLQPANLNISELHQRVVTSKQSYLTIQLQLFSFILAWALRDDGRPLSDRTLLECGGGIGMLSMLAKELGVGTVIFNDIYDVACNDASTIGHNVGLPADRYVEGDIDKLLSVVSDQHIEVDAIGSFDVIEHIYDIEPYLQKFARFRGRQLCVAMASGANMYNKNYTNETMEFQRKCELSGRKPEFGQYGRDSLRPYREIRREMISAHVNNLSEDDIETLAERTRGLRQDDIHGAVDEFLRAGAFPTPPKHPTNTCDPYTGNWQEHLMNPDELVAALSRAGFSADWLSGYFSCRSSSMLKRTAGKIANVGVRFINKPAVRIAPFYMLHAARI